MAVRSGEMLRQAPIGRPPAQLGRGLGYARPAKAQRAIATHGIADHSRVVGIDDIAQWPFQGRHVIHHKGLIQGAVEQGGAKGTLRTEGMYRYSRNPQYMADIGIVSGWMILSAAPWAMVVGLAGIAVLIAAPFSEEPWLKDKYGSAFEQYATRVGRFF